MTKTKLAVATLMALGASTVALAQQQTPAPRGGDRTEQVSFDRADKNADGRVSREEANDIDGFDFSRADTNNDASLSRQEYQAAMATSTPRSDGAGAARNDSGSARDDGRGIGSAGSARNESASRTGAASDDQRGSQSRGDSSSQRGGDQRTSQATFETADKNKDGKVTREEARDVAGLNFSSADVNNDSSLSRQEFQVAVAGGQPRG